MPLDWLNYHHLHYFWVVAQEGSVTRASRRLRLAPSTVSAQVRMLEESLGATLFDRSGRQHELTDTGRVVYRYADQIFALGQELAQTVHAGPTARPVRLVVGVADVLPKLIAYRLLAPALGLHDPVHLVVREGRPERLVAELELDELDLVLADSPVGSGRAWNHLLGEASVSFFAVPALAAERRHGFPRSLDGAPFVLPLAGTSLRRSLDRWLDAHQIRPHTVGEFEDGALLSVFGQAGAGVFAAPSVIEGELFGQYGVEVVGRAEGIREGFYAVSASREVQNPAILAIVEEAKKLFVETR
jgi:LysR family transcriptional activator of nhaA